MQGASFAAETLSAANDASSGNGEASSWPEVRHIRTTPLATPSPCINTSMAAAPIYFCIFMLERIFQFFGKRGRRGRERVGNFIAEEGDINRFDTKI